MDGPRAARAGNIPRTSVSPARLVVRRLRCRLGGSPRRPSRFRPLVSRPTPQLDKSSRALGDIVRSPAFSATCSQQVRGGLRGQYHCSGLPEESGGTRSAVLNQTAQELLRWAELHSVTLVPQFIMGQHNVLADALSLPKQVLSSEWI